MQPKKHIVITDEWSSLKSFTAGRIALGRAGISVPAKQLLQFKMDHAHARDAVFSALDTERLLNELQVFNLPVYLLKTRVANRDVYLKRPDLGRRLSQDSVNQFGKIDKGGYDVCITITDGLSATAIHNHCIQVLNFLIQLLIGAKINIAPVCVVEQGRVAIADETASLFKAKLSLIFIGERPGLSSPDSLGAYITYDPKPGLTDESRNCISNIRREGLNYKDAADKIFYLIKEAIRLKLSGVGLKESNEEPPGRNFIV